MSLTGERPAWQQQALCHGMTAMFFPTRGEDARPARAICAGCPVKTECLDFAIDGGDHHGVFGGTSERERRTMRRGDMPARACGKSNGAAAHRRRGEAVCDECKAYNAARTARYRAQRGAA